MRGSHTSYIGCFQIDITERNFATALIYNFVNCSIERDTNKIYTTRAYTKWEAVMLYISNRSTK